ncbi:hypothetical protein P3S67_017890 [Capsicum chacoense]
MSIHNLDQTLYSFLLLGSCPPGHGKTALAEALAEKMFDGTTTMDEVDDGTTMGHGKIALEEKMFDNMNVKYNKYEAKAACE